MYKLYQYIKHSIVHFKLERFCCVFPIRTGLLITGYVYILIVIFLLIGVVDGGFQPSLIAVQEQVDEDHVTPVIYILAGAAELTFNSVLLCGVYRNDIILLRVYMYFLMSSIVSSVLVYSIVFAAIDAHHKIIILGDLAARVYLILIVRSAIVEIKETQTADKNGDITLYSVVRTNDEDPTRTKSDEPLDVEAAVELKHEELKPEKSKPDSIKSKESNSDTLKTNVSKPDTLNSNESKSDGLKPKESKLDELKPNASKPDTFRPYVSKSDTLKSIESKSDGMKPKESKSDELKPKESNLDERKLNEPTEGIQQSEQKGDQPPTKLETVNEDATQRKRVKLFQRYKKQ